MTAASVKDLMGALVFANTLAKWRPTIASDKLVKVGSRNLSGWSKNLVVNRILRVELPLICFLSVTADQFPFDAHAVEKQERQQQHKRRH